MIEQRSASSNETGWWLSIQGTPTGPHSEASIAAGLSTGTISPQTYACRVGSQEWKRLSEWPEFAPMCLMPAVTPPPPPTEPGAVAASQAWDPRAIGWLGLLFSPVWAAVMAAMNARRLKVPSPIWRPVAIGAGATVLDLIVSSCIYDSCILDLALYLGALRLIWRLELAPQIQAFDRRPADQRLSAGFLLPGLAGCPLALVVLWAFVVYPLLPLQPRQVCERFTKASSERELAKYVTANMRLAIAALSKLPDDGTKTECELTDEGEAPANVGGYVVGYRMVISTGSDPTIMEGCFHLVQYGGSWKIEEIYIASCNGEQADPWLALSKNYRQLLAADRSAGRATAPGRSAGTASSSYPHPPTTMSSSDAAPTMQDDSLIVKMFPSGLRWLARLVFGSFGSFGVVVLLVLVALVIAGMRSDQTKNKP